MSRIGKMPIVIPAGVTVTVDGSQVTVKGKLGELTRLFKDGITCELEDGTLTVKRRDDSRSQRSLHGLTRTLIQNMIVGVRKQDIPQEHLYLLLCVHNCDIPKF